MNKIVFISGSIKIKKLPTNAIRKIDSIIDRNFSIIIGDAKGIDLHVQKYLLKKAYNNITVYYTGTEVRNNVGSWNTKYIASKITKRSKELYMEKDKAMANDADFGLMIWDGESKGTRNNIINMRKQGKRFFVVLDNFLICDNQLDDRLLKEDIEDTYQQQLF